jgi:hypothetical protein
MCVDVVEGVVAIAIAVVGVWVAGVRDGPRVLVGLAQVPSAGATDPDAALAQLL